MKATAYAARSFFDNGGSVLYVCRIAHYTDITDKSTLTAMESNMTIDNREATPAPSLQINAANHGTWGDRISVSIEDGSLDPANAFNLIVKYKDNIVEVFKELSMDEASANHVELMINEVSDYIIVSDLSPSTGTAEDNLPGHLSACGWKQWSLWRNRFGLYRRSVSAHRALRIR